MKKRRLDTQTFPPTCPDLFLLYPGPPPTSCHPSAQIGPLQQLRAVSEDVSTLDSAQPITGLGASGSQALQLP